MTLRHAAQAAERGWDALAAAQRALKGGDSHGR
jgi:hypothetical protein